MPLLRLDKILADAGASTRREAKELVRQGRVTVNGMVAASVETKYDPDAVTLAVDGKEFPTASNFYYMMYKPAGVVTATEDSDQQTVMDLLPDRLRRQGLFPVGRLDKDTTGLLILTNDGEFSHRLTAPRSHVPKRYRAVVDGVPSEADVRAFAAGIVLGDGTNCLPARLILGAPGTSEVEVVVCEGKYHQVKRMLASRGMPVQTLERCAIGGVQLDRRLAPGEVRALTSEEREALFISDWAN